MVSRSDLAANRAKAQEYGLTFPIGMQDSWKTSRDFGIFSTPVGFLLDETGRTLREVAVGKEAILATWAAARTACDAEEMVAGSER
jgi:hypothetical protein